MSTTYKIIIADDHTLFINGLQMLLKETQWIEVIEVANDGKELLEILTYKHPDIILLDINMPRMNGLETARYIRQTNHGVKIIMLSTYNENHLIEKAKENGVHGYLLKNSNKEDLLQAMKLVMDGKTAFPNTSPKERTVFDGEDRFLKQFNLTKREAEIIQLLKNGLTNLQIADKLCLSIYTVETHRKNIMQKLQLKSHGALIKFIVENNI